VSGVAGRALDGAVSVEHPLSPPLSLARASRKQSRTISIFGAPLLGGDHASKSVKSPRIRWYGQGSRCWAETSMSEEMTGLSLHLPLRARRALLSCYGSLTVISVVRRPNDGGYIDLPIERTRFATEPTCKLVNRGGGRPLGGSRPVVGRICTTTGQASSAPRLDIPRRTKQVLVRSISITVFDIFILTCSRQHHRLENDPASTAPAHTPPSAARLVLVLKVITERTPSSKDSDYSHPVESPSAGQRRGVVLIPLDPKFRVASSSIASEEEGAARAVEGGRACAVGSV
jgi:hypothetical protein